MWNFLFGFGVASVLWFVGILSVPKIKAWYAGLKQLS